MCPLEFGSSGWKHHEKLVCALFIILYRNCFKIWKGRLSSDLLIHYEASFPNMENLLYNPRRKENMEVNKGENSLANFLILCDLFYVEQVVQPSLVVVFGQSLVQDRLGEKLVGRQRDLIAGEQASLQFGHRLIGSKFYDGLARRIPALCRQQELLPGCHQVFQVWEEQKTGWVEWLCGVVETSTSPSTHNGGCPDDRFAFGIPSMEAASTMIRCISTGSEPKSKTTVCRKVPKISVLKPTATLYTQWSRPLSAATVMKVQRKFIKTVNHQKGHVLKIKWWTVKTH